MNSKKISHDSQMDMIRAPRVLTCIVSISTIPIHIYTTHSDSRDNQRRADDPRRAKRTAQTPAARVGHAERHTASRGPAQQRALQQLWKRPA